MLGMPGSPGTTHPLGAVGKLGRLQSGHDGLNLALRVIPGHTRFPAQARDSSVRFGFHFVSVLNKGATISGARIQELLAALVIVDRSADQEVGKIRSRLAAIEREIPIGCAGIALIDLQVAELAAELQGVGARRPSKSCRKYDKCCWAGRW